jgi:hypothetical protein
MITKADRREIKNDINDAISELQKVKDMLKVIEEVDQEQQMFLRNQIFETLNLNVRGAVSSAVGKTIYLSSKILF